ncbi:MAG: hypothetical protein A3D67_01655 [Candidatus Lloydbacteria bacterium RIFCSPHIGHO2_02_FULL_51_22]|uniref:Uncharacterized protein n=3 Tax=Candidatus Lloydiibacteriota TaxID=1817910 RepID=A0A1G2D6E1_9BACT|nr:MAG: hypothetical protein A3D67_01655 [Candidatus Lloydbacteria bacterium RIFCSPHIGHO2_02_FULL_51_22]OGZ15623.1 MAG: hypothetical protein A3J08_00290 [Candidatus Lloydbacteria bacterium RIFCSPLOWO2_02_FULL_51_11]OGZ15986.1 MAG: hypothetical protein A3G11_01360 [Candidatus Lloydbacteria bacterium RIFCSPLOWO2_12_FULL_51_9]
MKLDIKIVGLAIVALAILGYAYSRTMGLSQGPRIIVTEPSSGATITAPLVHVRGVAKNSVLLTLDGRMVVTDEAGVFDEEILLAPNYNSIVLTAEDRFGRSITEMVEVVRK